MSCCEKRAGKACKHRPHGEGGQLGVGGIDAERAAGDLVLAQGFPGATHRQAPQADGDECCEQGQSENEVVQEDGPVDRRKLQPKYGSETIVLGIEGDAEKGWARNPGNAGVAVGQIHPIYEHDADNFAKGERHDREIVAAQTQHRKAEQNSPERSEDPGERQQYPKRKPERLGEESVGVGAHCVKGDIAQVEQSRQADNDIQAPSKHDVDQDLDPEIVDPLHGAAKARGREHDRRIGNNESDCKGEEPFAGLNTPSRSRSCGPKRSLSEPGFDSERVGEAADADNGDHGQQQGPARNQDQIIADVGNGLEADQRQEQTERKQCSNARVP